MDITDEIINEIGAGLLRNNLFVDSLAKRLAGIVKSETLLKYKPSKLTGKIQEQRSHKLLVTMKDIYGDLSVVDRKDLKPLLIDLLLSIPVENDYYPIAPFVNTLGPLLLGSKAAWNRSKSTPAICAAALSLFDFISPTGGSDEYGYAYYEITRKVCKNIRCIRIPRLQLYQKLFLYHPIDLTQDFDWYKIYVSGTDPSPPGNFLKALKFLEKNPDEFSYTSFLDCLIQLEDEEFYKLFDTLCL